MEPQWDEVFRLDDCVRHKRSIIEATKHLRWDEVFRLDDRIRDNLSTINATKQLLAEDRRRFPPPSPSESNITRIESIISKAETTTSGFQDPALSRNVLTSLVNILSHDVEEKCNAADAMKRYHEDMCTSVDMKPITDTLRRALPKSSPSASEDRGKEQTVQTAVLEGIGKLLDAICKHTEEVNIGQEADEEGESLTSNT